MSLNEELQSLLDHESMLHASTVVEWAAENPNSELHKRFEWDDAIAGREYRLEQARRLIRLHVVTEAGEPKLVSLSYDRPRGGGYRPIEAVRQAPDLMKIMLNDALGELRRVRGKYQRVKALAPVWDAIEAAETEHKPETRVAKEMRA